MITRDNQEPPVLSLYQSHTLASIDMQGTANAAAKALDSNVTLNHKGNLVLASGNVQTPFTASATGGVMATITHKIQRVDIFKESRSFTLVGYSSTWVYQTSTFNDLIRPFYSSAAIPTSVGMLIKSVSFSITFAKTNALDTASGRYYVYIFADGKIRGNAILANQFGIVRVSGLDASVAAGESAYLVIEPVPIQPSEVSFDFWGARVTEHSFAWVVSSVQSSNRGIWSWPTIGGVVEASGAENYQPSGVAYRGVDMGQVPQNIGQLTIRAGESSGSVITISIHGTNAKADYDSANIVNMAQVYAATSIPTFDISINPYRYFIAKIDMQAAPQNVDSPELFEITANFSGVATVFASVVKKLGDGEQCLKSINSQSSQLNTSVSETSYGQTTVVLGLTSQQVHDVVNGANDGNIGVISAGKQELYRGAIEEIAISNNVGATLTFSDSTRLFDALISPPVTYSATHTVDIMLDLILNKLGAARSKVDIDSFNQVKLLIPYLGSRTLSKPTEAKKMLDELAWLACSQFAILQGKLALIPDTFVRGSVGRFSINPILKLDIHNCGGSNFTLKKGFKKGINTVLIEGGYTGLGTGQDKYTLNSIASSAADILQSDKMRFKSYQDNWGLSQAHLDDRAQKQLSAFVGGRWSVSVQCDISNNILQVGDIVQVDIPTLPKSMKNAAGIVAATNTDTLKGSQTITLLRA